MRLINQEIDPIQGLLTGKFKLKGDMAKDLRAVRAAKELVETAGNVPDLNRQLKEYYSLRGWDPKTGHPTMEKLRELELESLSRYLPTKN